MNEMHQCKRIHPHCQLRLTRDIWPDVNWHWGVTMPDAEHVESFAAWLREKSKYKTP